LQVTVLAAPSVAPAAKRAKVATLVGVAALGITLAGVGLGVLALRGKGSRSFGADAVATDSAAAASESPSSGSTAATVTPSAASAVATSSAALSDDAIGIPECDEYMRLWRDCYKDPLTRARAEAGFKRMTADYQRFAAGTPREREDTRASCEDSVKKFPHAICRMPVPPKGAGR
jgi:hypothetical protein